MTFTYTIRFDAIKFINIFMKSINFNRVFIIVYNIVIITYI